jgi:hypothetical protein
MAARCYLRHLASLRPLWPDGTIRSVPHLDPYRNPYTMATYSIFRSFAPHTGKPDQFVKTGLTLEQAKAHCKDPATRQAGVWFDFYTDAKL